MEKQQKSHKTKLFFYFQLIFAIIPPPGLLGGWPCFVVSLIMIGGIVIIVGDLAEIFGCLVGLHADVRHFHFSLDHQLICLLFIRLLLSLLLPLVPLCPTHLPVRLLQFLRRPLITQLEMLLEVTLLMCSWVWAYPG